MRLGKTHPCLSIGVGDAGIPYGTEASRLFTVIGAVMQ
jgi:hypothetical protein